MCVCVCLCALQLLARRDALRERAATRRKLLVDSLLLQQLYQDSDDLKTWINKKKKLADDEDYKVGRFAQPCLHILAVYFIDCRLEPKATDFSFTKDKQSLKKSDGSLEMYTYGVGGPSVYVLFLLVNG